MISVCRGDGSAVTEGVLEVYRPAFSGGANATEESSESSKWPHLSWGFFYEAPSAGRPDHSVEDD